MLTKSKNLISHKTDYRITHLAVCFIPQTLNAYIEGNLNAEDRYFTIGNAALRIGLNQITFTAELENGKIIQDSFYAVFYDENNLDENDSDSDGLLNWQEEFYDTDKNNADTDGDALSDYDEIYTLGLNPLAVDTDGNGINDGNEDFDGDNLTNAGELNGITQNGVTYTTDPTNEDTDGDTLTDYHEIYVSFTDPNKKDTDEDGVDDSIELEIGSNPLVAETVFTRTVSKVSTSEKVTVSVKLENSGAEAVNTLSVKEVTNDVFLTPDIPGYIDNAFEFTTNGEFNGAEITFNLSDDVVGSDFEPAIYYFNEEKQLLEKVANQTVSNNKRTVTASVTHFSKYIVANQKEFDAVWQEITMPSDTPKDIMFAICRNTDTAANLKGVYEAFIDELDGNDRVGLVFGDNSSLQVYRDLVDATDTDSGVDGIRPGTTFYKNEAGGDEAGELLSSPIIKAARILKENARTEADKYLIILSNGDGSFSNNINMNLRELIDDYGARVITIGVGVENETKRTLLQMISGDYFDEAVMADEVMSTMFPEIPDTETDSNNDGITDYNTGLLTSGLLRDGLGRKVFNNVSYEDIQKNNDYDGDGLKNGEEIQVNTYNDYKYIVYMSDPTKKDSDGDKVEDLYDANPMKKFDNRFEVVNSFDHKPKQDYVDSHIQQSNKCYNTNFRLDITRILESAMYVCGGYTIFGSSIFKCDIEDYEFGTGMQLFSYMLSHYLNSSGDPVYLESYQIESMIFSQITNLDHYIYNINQIINCAEEIIPLDSPIGTKIVLATKSNANFLMACYGSNHCNFNLSLDHNKSYGNIYHKLYDNNTACDFSQAVGNAFCTMVSEVTYYGNGRFSLELNYNLYDIYEFGYHYSPQIKAFDDFHMLHEAGHAKDFFIGGTYHTYYTWDYNEDIQNPNNLYADYNATDSIIIRDKIYR